MSHQCLKCGNIFPSGSPEILKGCNNCGGKKFFYTEQPVSEKERARLTEQANKDIKALIHEVLTQKGAQSLRTYDDEGRSVPGGDVTDAGAGWVKIIPDKKATTKASTKGEVAPGAPEDLDDEHKLPTVKELLEELRGKPELGLDLPEKQAGDKDKGVAKAQPKKKAKVKLKRKPPRGVRKRPIQPEVIKVVEPGVYEIYLSKLLHHFPIIINRDGSYLVHLPSVFESSKYKKK
jgi:predicted  nucleic acid-binding Zn-ribbon protein